MLRQVPSAVYSRQLPVAKLPSKVRVICKIRSTVSGKIVLCVMNSCCYSVILWSSDYFSG